MKLENLLNDIDIIIELMYKNKIVEAFEKLVKYMPYITKYMNELVANPLLYNDMRINIHEDAIIKQLKSLIDGIKNKDVILIADTLKYEILEELKLYNGILM